MVKRRKRGGPRRPHIEPKAYAPGYFMQPVFAWWPDWHSLLRPAGAGQSGLELSKRATQAREEGRLRGEWWSAGTVPGLGTPSNPGKAGRIRKPSAMG